MKTLTTLENGLRAACLTSLALAALVVGGCGEDAQTAPDAGSAEVEVVEAPAPDAILASYDRGTAFLRNVMQDGVISIEGQGPQVGLTALALANMLERPGGPNDADREAIDLGLAFIAKSINTTGSVDESYRPNYETAVVIMALAASGKAEYKDEVEQATKFIKSLQRLDETNPTYGGIGYGSDNTRSDLSNTQYALASLRAAGITEDDPVFQRAITFLQRTHNRKENEGPGEPTKWEDPKTGKTVVRGNDGGANYFPGNSKGGVDELPDGSGRLRSYGSMTYALLRCYHFAGLDASDPRVKSALDWVTDNWTLEHNPGMAEKQRFEGLYYYYATMGKTLPLAGVDEVDAPTGKVKWRAALSRALLARQRDDGSWLNENSERWMEGNPILATSYALTALASCVE